MPTPNPPSDAAGSLLPQTRWTEWLDPIHQGTPAAATALDQLCRAYWQPIYRYVRWRGHAHHRAEELTQDFISSLLRRESFVRMDRARGRFRSFLLSALRNFLITEHSAREAQKRIPEQALGPVDDAAHQLPAPDDAGDAEFDKEWARATLDRALVRLGQDYRSDKKGPLFADLKPFLSGNDGRLPRPELAARHQLTAGSLDVAILRLRGRYREIILEEIQSTVATPEEASEEFRHLVQVVGATNLLAEPIKP